jgi:hypothetical protein
MEVSGLNNGTQEIVAKPRLFRRESSQTEQQKRDGDHAVLIRQIEAIGVPRA